MTAHILSVILALACLLVGVGAGTLLGEKLALTREIAQERADLADAAAALAGHSARSSAVATSCTHVATIPMPACRRISRKYISCSTVAFSPGRFTSIAMNRPWSPMAMMSDPPLTPKRTGRRRPPLPGSISTRLLRRSAQKPWTRR